MNMNDRQNIILDLDNCCIHGIAINEHKNDNKMVEFMANELKKTGMDVANLKYKFDFEENARYVLLFNRPHLQTFLQYLLKNYNVSIWSNGFYTYVDRICDIIFSKAQKKQLKYIIGATDNPTLGVYDITNKKMLYNYESYKKKVKNTKAFTFNTYDVKDLSFLWKTKPYSNLFTKQNTLLIDDSDMHYFFNKTENVIRVKFWLSYDKNDNSLLDVITYLKNQNMSLKIKNSKKIF